MKKYKQFTFAMALLIIVCMPSAMFIQYQARKWYARLQMEERLEQQQLHTLRIPIKELQWHKNGEEIIVQGKLFDVRTSTILNNILICEGLFDDEETLIKSKLEQFGKNGSPETDAGNQLTLKFVSMLVYFSNKDPFSSNCYITDFHLPIPYIEPYSPQVFPGVEAPPPRV